MSDIIDSAPTSDVAPSTDETQVPTDNTTMSPSSTEPDIQEKDAQIQEITQENKNRELDTTKIPNTENEDEKTKKLIKNLKIASLIITIIAGIGSIVYYIYSMMVGDTMLLKPADTVIIQNSDLQLDQAIAKDKNMEQSVIDKVLELQKTKRDFVPLDYYVGKIQDITVITPEIWSPEYYNGQWNIDLKIQKTYDILNKKRLDESISCSIDKVNLRYFQKWVTLSGSQIDIPSRIKIRNDDLIGFRYTSQNNKNTCEIFQVNEVNLQEYISKLNSLLPKNTEIGSAQISWRIENFLTANISGNGIISDSLISSYNNDYLPFFVPEDVYKLNPMGVMITAYHENNPRLPLINIICKLSQKSAQELYGFFKSANLQPKEGKNRIILNVIISGKPISQGYQISSETPMFFPSFFYNDCNLEKISLLDMGERNIIDSHSFEN